ncbi:MAG TPA: ABC transporter permease [Amaricoccus sp.]|uniref:ABC transporter permease n=1 Tax=Amaricoccus sp. TaxID=1872485 RepID=UPI002C6166F9|nr:ABC transporter permease [Amaricoccus sp.]HMQ94119.1 ABC transporter permease [Amaricoccus sp.]HMR53003.1 ABC transporter permease [Amaricoccus sp.]HMR59128.1 ABC transporter permease [Amaricoccus sp.]HMT99943.1 ABC transporter permease [Amaricoccus sp.]
MTEASAPAPEGRPPLRIRWALAFVVFAVFFAVNAWLQPSLLTARVLASNLTSFLPLVLVAIGQTYVVLAGDIDLSAGAIIALVNVSVVSLIEQAGGSGGAIALGLAAGIALGILCGLLNGLLVAVLRLQAIVTTFATSIVFGGIALWILPQAGGSVPQAYWRGYAGGLGPVKLTVILFLVALGTAILCSRMRWYRHLLAIGGNRLGAFQSGLAVTRQRVISYVLCGLFAALAALCLVGETASADPLLGPSFTLTSISAVVLGGTALAGGRGGVIGSILGALTLGLINNIVFFAKLPYVTQDLVKGLIILAALAGGILGARR